MELDRLKYLESRFWSGDCSEIEEMELRQLMHDQKPEHSVELADLRDYLSIKQTSKVSLGRDFDEKVLTELKSRSNNKKVLLWASIAASLILIISMSVMAIKNNLRSDSYAHIEDTYTDPEEAFQAVQEALKLVSGGINEGAQYGAVLSEFENTTTSIKKL